jgi:hypothetical protein
MSTIQVDEQTTKTPQMKKIQTFLIAALSAMFIFASCAKDNYDVEYITINSTLAPAQTYELNLSKYGESDDNYSILQSSQFGCSSQIRKDNNIFKFKYHSVAENSIFFKNDQVKISIDNNRRGNCNNGFGRVKRNKTVIIVNFTIL